jgi:hypothetical protein
MEFDTQVKLAIYRHFAAHAARPRLADIAAAVEAPPAAVRDAYQSLARNRVLVLEADGETIRMAPPFSGVPTQHQVQIGPRRYFANCAWDALGIPAALHAAADVYSRCEQSGEPLHIRVREGRPRPEPCVIHFAVPAAHWWADIVYT